MPRKIIPIILTESVAPSAEGDRERMEIVFNDLARAVALRMAAKQITQKELIDERKSELPRNQE